MQRRVAASIAAFMIVAAGLFSGCGYWVTHRFEITRPSQPTQLLDRYTMTLSGSTTDSKSVLIVFIDFVEEHTDTTGLDSIPILMVDSVRFEGGCLEEPIAVQLRNEDDVSDEYYDQWLRAAVDGRAGWWMERLRRFTPDLAYRWGRVLPSNYELRTPNLLPQQCTGTDLQAQVFFREIDRVSDSVMVADSRRFWFRVKTYRGFSMGLS